MSRLNWLLLTLVFSMSTARAAQAGDDAELQRAMTAGAKTPAQQQVSKLMSGLSSARQQLGCESHLTSTGAPAVASLPPWLDHLARKAYLENVAFDAKTIHLLNGFEFNSNLRIEVKPGGKDAAAISELVLQQWLEVPPAQDPASHGPVRAVVSNLTVGNGDVSFALDVLFANGQALNLWFPRVELRREQVAPRVARLVIAAINHREALRSEEHLRQEMNAFRYDLGKLLRVASPDHQRTIERLRQALVDGQPKRGTLKTLAISLGLQGDGQNLGVAFVRYLRVREEMVELAQAARVDRLDQAPAGPEGAVDAVQIINRARPSVAPGRLAQAYVAPKPKSNFAVSPAPRVRSRLFSRRSAPTSTVDDSYLFNTYVWWTDPGFMMTHPLYWGAPDGSFRSHMMYWDWMTDQRHRHDHPFVDQTPPTPQHMGQFDRPVDPLYTNDQARPFADPWGPSVPAGDLISPRVEAGEDVSWTDARGNAVDFYYLPAAEVDRQWDRVTGDSSSTPAAPTMDLSPTERDRFDAGTDGSGFGRDNTPTGDSDRDLTGS